MKKEIITSKNKADSIKTIVEKAKEVPVVREVDVLVVGGGYAGFGAAICAARNGAKTLLVERESALGGLATLGLVSLTFSYMEGVAYELFAQLKKEGAVKGRFIDPEKTKRVLETMLLNDAVEILYNTTTIDAIMDGNTIKGAIIFNKGGRQAIMAKRVIDTSGDGDISAFAGAPFECGSPEHNGYNQSTSLVMRVGNVDLNKYHEALVKGKEGKGISLLWQDKIEEAVKNGEFPYMIDRRLNWAVVIPGRDPHHQEMCLCFPHSRNCRNLDGFDISRQLIEQRKQAELTIRFAQRHIPGFENAWLIETAPMLGVRDARRITGEYVLKAEDVANNKTFEDAVVRDMHHFDAHHPTSPGHIKHIVRKTADGKEEKVYTIPGTFREVPYRCLVPLKIDNLLVGGRCFSSDFMAQATVRLVLACLNMGQAAGTAAALSLKENITPRKLNPSILRKRLIETGFTLERKPEYGVDGISTNIQVDRDDIVYPKTEDEESSAVRLKGEKYYQVNATQHEETRLAGWEEKLKERGGYTSTGGDVGTYLE